MRIPMLVAVVVLLGGCGASSGSDGSAQPAGPSDAPSDLPSRAPSQPPEQLTPSPPDKGGGEVEAAYVGTVAAGVEAGCMLLQTGDGQELLLLGDLDGARSGDRLSVRGVLQPDALTTCMQGTPFRVTSVERLP